MLDFIVDYLRLIISGHMNTFEIEALMDEEIETHESEAEVPANSLALVGGLTSGVWYCCGCNGGRSRVRVQPIVLPPSWCAYRTCDGGDFPRHFIGLRIYFPH